MLKKARGDGRRRKYQEEKHNLSYLPAAIPSMTVLEMTSDLRCNITVYPFADKNNQQRLQRKLRVRVSH